MKLQKKKWEGVKEKKNNQTNCKHVTISYITCIWKKWETRENKKKKTYKWFLEFYFYIH
jgi:hypothetical protein